MIQPLAAILRYGDEYAKMWLSDNAIHFYKNAFKLLNN